MLRKDLLEPDRDSSTTPYILQCHLIGDRAHVWRAYQGLWNCITTTDARTRALSIMDAMGQDTFEMYDGWRVIQVLYYSPEVDA